MHPPAYFLPDAARVLIYGFLGVEAFFLISGFVILMSGWGRTVREFAASRAARLYPAFWAGVLITTVVTAVLPIRGGLPFPQPPGPADVLVNLTMLAEPLNTPLVDTVYWTLWTEFRFYLIVAGLLAAGLTDRRVKVFGTVWLWVLLVACWLVSLQHVHARVLDLRPGFAVAAWPALVLLTAMYAILLAVALGATDRLDWRRLGTAGALTYPFYLLHQRIGYSLIRTVHAGTGLPAPTLIGGAVLVLLAVAWLVHRFVERPLAPLVRAFIDKSPEPGVAEPTGPNMRQV